MTLNLNQMRDSSQVKKKPKDMTIDELTHEIKKLKSEGVNPIPLITEINEKIALAFSCLVFVLLGSSLAIITRRREKSLNFGLAFMVAGIYYVLLISAEAVSLQGYLNPAIAMWLPNIIMGGIGAFLAYRLCAS